MNEDILKHELMRLMRSSGRVWSCPEPGILAMLGTRFRIMYMPGELHPDFRLYEDQRLIARSEIPAELKHVAEKRQAELEEMDAG
jgi:hypothetical protein